MPSLRKIPPLLRSPSGQILSGRVLQFGSQLALVLLLPRLLSHEDFVQYSLVTPLGYLIGSITCGWINAAICRFAHEFLAPTSGDRREATASYFFQVGFLALIAYAVLQFGFQSELSFAALVVFSSSVRSAALGVLNAGYLAGPFLKVTLLYLIPPTIFLTLCGTPAFASFESAMLVYIGVESVVGMVIAARAGIPFWRVIDFKPQLLGPYLKFGGPLVLNGIAIWLLSLSDRYFLALWSSTEETANYILSYQLAGSIVQYPVSFYMSVFGPKVLQFEQAGGLARAIRYVYSELRRYLVIAPVALGGCTVVVLGFKYLFYSNYNAEPAIIIIIVAAHLIHAASHFYVKELELTGRTIVTARAIFVGAGINVLANVLLIPQTGAHGAAVATLLGYIAYTAIIYRATRPPDAGHE